MKALVLALALISPLLACVQGELGNQEVAATNDVAVAAAEENVASPAGVGEPGSGASDRGNAAPSAPRDVPIEGPQSRSAAAPADEADQCGASRYQWLVGQPRSAIPPQPAGARWRVTCTGCPITMDYSLARLNIFYDSETERVEEVRCG
jgi:hypothetical protein